VATPVRFAKLRNQLESAGCRLVRISGSHHVFDRPGGPLVSFPVHNNLVKPFYAQQVARVIASDRTKSRSDKPKAEGQENSPKTGDKGKGKQRPG
jgi:predicted RNA binding protein YcfA (HicA-like mRNA interferase family)